MRTRIPLIGGQNQPGVKMLDDQLCVNWEPRTDASGKRGLHPSPGLKRLFSAGPGPCRGNGMVFQGAVYFVSGNTLIRIDDSMAVTEIGPLETSKGPVSIAAGFSAMAIVDGQFGYKWDGNTFEKIVDPDMPQADFVEWIDKYFIYNSHGQGTFYISALEDPADINGLDYANAEARPDNIQRPIEMGGDLLCIGEYSSEFFRDTGNPLFPWEPYLSAVLPWGTPAPWTAARLAEALFILATQERGGYKILRVSGSGTYPISTPAMEKELSKITISDAFAFAYVLDGRGYYQISFPASAKEYCWDDTEKAWSERKYADDRHFGHAFFNGRHILGDMSSSILYEFDPEYFKDGDETIRRVRRGPMLSAEGREITIHRLEIQIEPGVGLTTGQGMDPKVFLRSSWDGGSTWSSELWGTPGKKGEYKNRLVFSKLGSGDKWTPEIAISDPVNCVITDAWADVTIERA